MGFLTLLTGSPLRKNILANFGGIGVQLLNQVLLVPVFLRLWDVKLYGDWIVISAISSFFTMTDGGLNAVTSNRFTISFAAGKLDECRTLLANNYLLLLIMGGLSVLGSMFYVGHWNIVTNLGLHQLDRQEANYIFVALILQVYLGMGSSVIDAIYRANLLNHKLVNLSNLGRLAEFCVMLLALLLHLKIWLMVTIFQMPRLVFFAYKLLDTRKYFAYGFRLRDVDLPLLRSMVFPSLTFMAFPGGNAIVYQGFTLLVNKLFGVESVVLFNTTRTLSSFLRQALSVMQQAVWPEYSIAYGKKDIARMRSLHRKAFAIAMSGGLLIGSGLMLAGPWIYSIWTHGKIPFSASLMGAFLVVMLIEVMWTTSSVCMMATNNHAKLGVAYLAMASVSLLVAAGVAQLVPMLPMIQLSLLCIHIPLSVYAVSQALEMTQDTFWELFHSFDRLKPYRCLSHLGRRSS